MAKMRVHELAKELNVTSKEIIGFLEKQNIEAKTASSTLDDDQVAIVKTKMKRKTVGTSAEKKSAADVALGKDMKADTLSAEKKVAAEGAATEKKRTADGESMNKTAAAEGTQAEKKGIAVGEPVKKKASVDGTQAEKKAPAAEGEAKRERPKKKSNISAVFNPQNSKLGDRRGGSKKRGDNKTRIINAGERPARPDGERPRRPARPDGERTRRPARPDGEKRQRPVRPDGERRRVAAERPVGSEGEQTKRPAGERPARPEGEHTRRPAGERPVRPAGERPVRPAGERPVRPEAERPAHPVERRIVSEAERAIVHRPEEPEKPAERPKRRNVYADRPQNTAPEKPARQGGDRNGKGEKRDFRDRKGDQNRRGNSGGGQGGRNGRPDGQNRFGKDQKGGRVDDRGGRMSHDAGKASLDELRGKDSRNNNNNNNRKKKQDYDKKSRKQENFINLEKKTGHKKRNAVPQAPAEKETDEVRTITLPEIMTVRELAEIMKVQPSEIVKKLFLQGQMITVNQELEYEKAEEIALEFNCIAEPEEKVDVIAELLKEEEEDESTMVTRPPVVCVMGHVDHGKTSLLDAIRNTHVTDREAGGITQAIGASVVSINGQKITFLDTPGHEAFTAMRMRGANSTDIAILVVAADDGVMPQTVEAINHAKAAGVEIIVAINKIDKEGANIDRVKQELTEYELIPEDWGGSTICVPVSAHTGEGIKDLLEMILLSAEVLELKANPKRNARGLVIEAQLDKGRGPVATVLVQKGTLKVGQAVAAGSSFGKVRAMIDDRGKRVKEAGPSMPVEILGLDNVPNAGEVFVVCDSEKDARSFAETFVAQDKERLLAETRARMSLDDLFSRIQEGNLKELNLIVKADVQGSVEAVKQSLAKLSNEEVVVKIIHGGVGAINESDVSLAAASNAIIIGFNVKPDPVAKSISEQEKVDIRLYNIIYKAIEDIEAAMKGMLDPIFEEKIIGHAEVRQLFKASGVGNIAGSYVLDGVLERGCKIRITREGKQIYEGSLASLKRFKDDVKEVKAGFECGLVFEGFGDIAELDQVEAYKMVEVPR